MVSPAAGGFWFYGFFCGWVGDNELLSVGVGGQQSRGVLVDFDGDAHRVNRFLEGYRFKGSSVRGQQGGTTRFASTGNVFTPFDCVGIEFDPLNFFP